MNTSTQALEQIKPVEASIKARVLAVTREAGADGVTVDDVELKLGLRADSVRPRFADLLKSDMVYSNGTRRNSRGRNSQVWIAKPQTVAA